MSRIINELKDLQAKTGWLADADLKLLSDRVNVPLYHLQGLASFYPHFKLEPPAKLEVLVCQDLSCHLRGSTATCAALKLAAERRAPEVRVAGVSCLGRCESPTAVAFNNHMLPAFIELAFASTADARR